MFIVSSFSCLCPIRHQAIIWTSAGIMLIRFSGTNSVKSQSKFIHFHSIKCTWKRRLENVGHFAPASMFELTYWGRVTHICVSKLAIIGLDNGLSPDRRQAIIWTNAGLLLIGPFGTKFSEILIEILTFSFKKMHLKVSSAKRRPFCLGLNVLTEFYKTHSLYMEWGQHGILSQTSRPTQSQTVPYFWYSP